jgi:hypothetical protein
MAPRLSPGCAALRWWPSARSEAGRGFSLPRVHLTNPRHSRFNVRVRDTTHSLLVLKPRPSVAPGRGFLFDSRRGFDLNRRMRSFTASHIRERRRAPVSSAHTDRGFSLSGRHDLAQSLHESLLASDPFNPTGRMSVQPR